MKVESVMIATTHENIFIRVTSYDENGLNGEIIGNNINGEIEYINN